MIANRLQSLCLFSGLALFCLSTREVAGVGAVTPFTTLEAEAGTLGGGAAILSMTSLPSAPTVQLESSGRKCVELNAPGESVTWTNAMITCQGYLWIEYLSPAVGTLDIDGGTINVSGQLGLGWSGGAGYVDVRNGGILDLSGFHATQSISGASVIDIESGTVVINGNQTGAVSNYITAGKFTACHGTGTLEVDYIVHASSAQR